MKSLRARTWMAVVGLLAMAEAVEPAGAMSYSVAAASHQISAAMTGQNTAVIPAAHRERNKGKFGERQFRRHHDRFHERYKPSQHGYEKGHRRFHSHYRRSHRGPSFYFDFGPRYYDPWYYDPYQYDPYYYLPPYRAPIGCARAARLLRSFGYTHVKAFDCAGDVYGFNAVHKGRRYRITMSGITGRILTRRRY